MAYYYNGYGTFGTSSGTNTGLSLNSNITNIATSAFNGNLKGFNSAYPRGAGTRADPGGGCTWWASGRAAMAYGNNWSGASHAGTWFSMLGGVRVSSWSEISDGDILCFGNSGYGHVAFVEAIGPSDIYVSEGASGNNNWNVIMMSHHDHGWFNSGHHWFWSDEIFQGVLKGSGSGGGVTPSPVEPDAPTPSGYTKFKLTVQKIDWVTVFHDYTSIYECGNNPTFGHDSGNQDEPKAPTHISSSSSRRDQRWEPFNMYTYERKLTYKSDKSENWSDWDMKYSGSSNFPLGSQPQYGNGWEIEWNDERDN